MAMTTQALASRLRSGLMPPCPSGRPDEHSTKAIASRRRSSSRCVWLYYRFRVSLRDVSELMLARWIEVSYETIRLWTFRFGTEFARRLRRTRAGCSTIWHLDERCLMINGQRGWLWRAVMMRATFWTSSFNAAGAHSPRGASRALS